MRPAAICAAFRNNFLGFANSAIEVDSSSERSPDVAITSEYNTKCFVTPDRSKRELGLDIASALNGAEFQMDFHWHVLDKGVQHVNLRPRTPRLNGKGREIIDNESSTVARCRNRRRQSLQRDNQGMGTPTAIVLAAVPWGRLLRAT